MHRVTKPDQLAKTTKSGIGSHHVALDGPEGLSKKPLYTHPGVSLDSLELVPNYKSSSHFQLVVVQSGPASILVQCTWHT